MSDTPESQLELLTLLGVLLLLLLVGASAPGIAGAVDPQPSALDGCLDRRATPRVARVVDPRGSVVYALVLAQEDGVPTRFAAFAPGDLSLAQAFLKADLAAKRAPRDVFEISAEERAARICSPIPLSEESIDSEQQVIVAAGLNYAAHAEEAGGGDVFVFPKPSAPTGAYLSVHPPGDVFLFDYEVELGLVLLADIDPTAPPTIEDLARQVAFFVANDLSDRGPIIRNKTISGPGTGFAQAKGRPGFLPAGPWLVRGEHLFAALEACGVEAHDLELQLWIHQGAGPELRQQTVTGLMILGLRELIARIGDQVEAHGSKSDMPFTREGETRARFYPLASGDPPRLRAGSIVLTGTPGGIALTAPSPVGVTLRGAVRLRSPMEQFLAEETAAFEAGERPRYLSAGEVVEARITGLGTQRFAIGDRGTPPPVSACSP